MTSRFSAVREIGLGLGAYGAYLLVRRAVWTEEGRTRARANARRIVAVERRLRIDVELALQDRALRRGRLAHGLNLGYAVFNVGLSVGWLVRLFRRRDGEFHRLRRQVLLAHAGALPVFLAYPTAPPRSLPGFVDTMARVSGIDLEHPLLVRLYNPLAAMPSQHVSLAIVTGSALAARYGRGAHAYAPLVGLVVVATGNHFTLDVAAGALLGVLARRLA